MKQGLLIRQSHGLAMTPQLTESIKILQMGSLDLIPYIANEIEQNPFLEHDDSSGQIEDNNPAEQVKQNDKIQSIDKLTQNWEDDEVSPAIYENESLIYSGTKSGKDQYNAAESLLDQVASNAVTLREHVMDQINVDIKDPIQRVIALYLTEYLDDSGYLIADMALFAQILKCDYDKIEEVIAMLQQFDPPGVFARNLGECLEAQLRDKGRFDPAMQALLENLDLMAKCDIRALKKICAVDEEDIKQMFFEIRALNPKPGNNFSSENVQTLQADIFLRQDQNGNWLLELNNDALPRVLVNRRYYSQIEAQAHDKESKKFMSQNWGTANWLAKALDQRANTILKVATQIVAQQDNFLRYGIHYLKPLVIKDIAEAAEVHESTVSRVINGKYMATHMGTYELKYFFSSGVGDGDISSKRIKHMIKQIIDSEHPHKILSDDKIAALLKCDGFEVARRTVMKYREALHIPSSVQRRIEKALC